VFDLERALQVLPVPGDLEGVRLSTTLSSPGHVAAVEHLRPRVSSQLLGEPVAVDVFLWAGTPNTRSYLTRIGGVPHRERSLAWPTDRQGRSLRFLGQLCFADSMDVLEVEQLPGELLLVFAGADWANVPMRDDPFVLEWSSIDLAQPTRVEDLPEIRSKKRDRPPLVPELYGVRHRTAVYPDAFLDEEAPWLGDAGSYRLSEPQATLLGSSAFYIQGATREGRQLIATLSSTVFSKQWPLVDFEDPRGLVDLQWGNLGCLYFEMDGDGVPHVHDEHY